MSAFEGAPARYRAGLAAGDRAAVLATLSPGVVLHSPITKRFRFSGIDEVTELFEVLFDELGIEDVVVHQEIQGDGTAALFHRATVGGTTIEEATLMRLDAEGRIAELTLYIRPLPAVTSLLARLGPRIARRRSRMRSVAATLAMAPLAFMTRRGDAAAPWLAGRRRG